MALEEDEAKLIARAPTMAAELKSQAAELHRLRSALREIVRTASKGTSLAALDRIDKIAMTALAAEAIDNG